MSVKKCLTQKEIESLILEYNSDSEQESEIILNKNTQMIYIPPPNEGDVTDEENIEENELVTDIPPTKEICGEIEIKFDSQDKDFSAPIIATKAEDVLCSQHQEYAPEQTFGVPKWKKIKRYDLNFSRPDESLVLPQQNKIVETMDGKSPTELFLQYFDEEIMDMLLKNTNIYANQKNMEVKITKEHLYRFIGILILSGYHTVPHIQHYWSSQPTLGVPIVKQALSRHMFQTIKKAFHVMDNNEMDVSDRFAKIRPLIDALNRKYKQFGIFSTHLSIDEQMIPYFGRHNCKMFIRGKPIRFGFKYWCLCSDTGYLFETHPYAGSSSSYNKHVGLGASVVLKLLESVTCPENHAVYFDNFFSSYYLFCLLNERKFRATGTVRANRLRGANDILATGRCLKKYDYDYCIEKNNKLFVARWQDNSEVTVISNFVAASPEVNTSRYSKDKKKMVNLISFLYCRTLTFILSFISFTLQISVPQPQLINHYNKHMGGVDLHDNAVSNYRIAVRGKKWWWPLWTNAINSTTVNAWKIHCLVSNLTGKRPLSQIDFKVEIATKLLLFKEKSVEEQPEEDMVQEEMNKLQRLPRGNVREHVVWKIPDNKRRRCQECHSQTVFQCKKCNISLHPKCFDTYHSKNHM